MPDYPTWQDALTYVLDGMPVIQVDRHPKQVSANGWSSTAHPITDPDYIRRARSLIWPGCAPAGHNLAGVCGCGFVAFDVDPAEGSEETIAKLAADGLKLPRTRTHRTPSGGRHLIYRAPEGTRGGKLGDGLMLRGWGPNGGSHVVLPPSVVDGNTYVVVDHRPPVELPGWVPEYLTHRTPRIVSPPENGQISHFQPEPVDLDALPSHLATFVGDAPEFGRRSDQVLRFVCNALEWGYSAGQALTLAREYKPAIDKYGGRLDVEVGRILAKVAWRHQHPGLPCDRAGCPNTPGWMGVAGERAGAGP
jgi:hypothetical protein